MAGIDIVQSGYRIGRTPSCHPLRDSAHFLTWRRKLDALANSRQLLSAQAVENALGPDKAAEGDEALGFAADPADPGGRASRGGAGENLQSGLGLGFGQKADETAFVRDVGRFEAENFACS